MLPANDNRLSEWSKLQRTGFYGLEALGVTAVCAGAGLTFIPLYLVFAVTFAGFGWLGSKRR